MDFGPVISDARATHRRKISEYSRALAGVARQRADAMAEMYAAGKTLAEIGFEYGVSRERVRQIIGKVGMSYANGRGIHFAKLHAERAALLDERYMARSGCTREQWLQIPKKIRTQCWRKRGQVIHIYGPDAWAMTRWEYYLEVKRAGVNVKRGGLGMTRIDPTCPFAPGNVKFTRVGSHWREKRLAAKVK